MGLLSGLVCPVVLLTGIRMGRIGKTDRVPKTRAGGEWTEAAFWGFLRSGLRQMTQRWPPIVRLVFENNRRPYVGPNKRQKFEYLCSECQQWFPRAITVAGKSKAQVHVDHIEECGKLACYEDVGTFVKRLFCEADGLRLLCKSCHAHRAEVSREMAKLATSPKE